MPGPLAGIRVLEVTQIIAGPFCGQTLADLGADVVKIEPPGGEAGRALGAFMPGESKTFHSLNRGKHSLVLNLQDPAAQAVVHRIISFYDVFIMNARPGVPDRLKVDYDTLRRFRPDLIWVENSGYGTTGPSATRSGSDVVAQAFSGLMAGDGKVDEFGAPLAITATAPSDYTAALASAMGVCAALFHRERTGEGQKVSTTLLGSALALQGAIVSRLPAYDAIVRDPAMERVNEVRARNGSFEEILDARGNIMKMLGAAFRLYYGGYRVKDGAIILGALTPANREQMRRVIGISGEDPTADPNFNAYGAESEAQAEAVAERIRSIMLTKTMDEWIAAFDAEGAPASQVNLPEEMADDPQVQALGVMVALDHELTGPELMVGSIVEMSATPTGTMRAAPPLDAHTDELLREHGFTASEIEALRASGGVGQPAG